MTTMSQPTSNTRPEMPRDYMKRCAQFADRAIFQYRDDLVAGVEYMRFIGCWFTSAESAQRWDDAPGNLRAWYAFETWEFAEAWLFGDDTAPYLATMDEG